MLYADKEEAAKKIAKIFKQMGWRWLGSFVPDEAEIIKSFEEKEKHLLGDKKASSIRSGRIYVERVRGADLIVFGMERDSVDEWSNWCEYNLPIEDLTATGTN